MNTKKKIKKYYNTQSEKDLSSINTFYARLKVSNHLFYYLTNKEQESNFLKHQIQKIIYYLVKILMREKDFLKLSSHQCLTVKNEKTTIFLIKTFIIHES